MSNTYSCTPRTAKGFLADIVEAGLVPFLRSSPGMGKSTIIRGVGKEFNLEIIDHRLSTSRAEDLTGYPRIEETATFVPFDIFPTEKFSTIPEGKDGFLLFLDEFNSAPKHVQSAAYKVILDRFVGQYALHPNTAIILAGNKDTDRAITNVLSTAMQSRVIHLEMEVSFQEWLEDVAIPQGYPPEIIAYLANKPSALLDFRPDHNDKTFCCPRTWEFMANLLTVHGFKEKHLPIYAGTITSGEAISFTEFVKVKDSLPSVEEIIKNPVEALVPQENGKRYLIVSFLAQAAKKDNIEKLLAYMSRLPVDMRVLFLRTIRISNPALEAHPAVRPALIEVSKYLND